MFLRVSLFLLSYVTWSHCASDDLQKDGVCPPVLDIIILFDTSGGNDTVYQQQKNWTIEVVRELPIHEDAVRVGLIQYSEGAKTEFNLSRYSERNDLIKNLDTLEFIQGDTKTGIALNKADEDIFNYAGGARLKANRMIILFTDGLSMDNPTKAAKTLRRKGVKIFAISVNSIGFVPEMLGIVGDADNIYGPMDEERLKERLLGEVEHSRSCDVQPRKNEKTTSAFKSRTTELSITATSAVTLDNTAITDAPELSSSTIAPLSETKENEKSLESTNTSQNLHSNNNIEDFGNVENFINTTSTLSPAEAFSHAWSEPIQLFTVESGHLNEVQHLTNLTNLLADEPAGDNSTDTTTEGTAEAVTHSEDTTISTLTTLAPAVTTICITQPVTTSTVSPITSTSQSPTTETLLTKLGVKKEKDPISKFLGKDIPNITTEKENELGKSISEKTGSSLNTSEDESTGEIGQKSNSSEDDKAKSEQHSSTKVVTKSSSPAPTTRFAFATRVTFRPVFSFSTKTPTSTNPTTTHSSTTSTTAIPTTITTTTTSPPTTTTIIPSTTTIYTQPSTTNVVASTPSSTKTPPRTSTNRFSPTATAAELLSTLEPVTAFPTLLSMEKTVTLPINKAAIEGRPMKKKIRRIIKRRRNILPSSQAKKVTDKIVEVKHEPTPTTPPVRSTLKPDVVEEKQEEITSPGVQCPMDILFVVDSSGSIARTYDTQKDFLTVLIKKVEPSRSHRVGLIQFAGPHIQKMEWSFDTHSKNSQLLSAIRSVRHLTGTTYIGAALELSLILLDSRRKHTETTVILISDGFSQDDSTQQAKLLRQLPNVKMYAISLNKLTNTRYLTDIVGDRKNLFVNDESKWFEEFFTKKLRCIPTRR